MNKHRLWPVLLLLALSLAACGVPPVSTPAPTPLPTDTPTPLPTPTPMPTAASPTPTPMVQEGMRIEKTDQGFLFRDQAYGYAFLLPGESWIPFFPGQDDLDTVFAAAKKALPGVDVDATRRLLDQTGVEFRIFAFYTEEETRSDDFAVNLNVNAVPLDQPYGMNLIIALNKEQLVKVFPNASLEADSVKTNEQGVRLGMITIRNEIAMAADEPFPLAQTFLFFQTPDNALITVTISAPWEAREALDPVIAQIGDSITFAP